MNSQILRANALLLLVAVIWGMTFVAQRVGMADVGPFTFNFVRFSLGALLLAPFAWRIRPGRLPVGWSLSSSGRRSVALPGSLLAGAFLFLGISLQQVGLVTTTAANGGFITGLYVIIVPLIGAAFGMRTGAGVWIGALLGVAGLYLLSFSDTMHLARGDLWVFIGAFAWAGHVLMLGWLSPRIDSYVLAFGQALVCAVLSFAVAWTQEEIRLASILAAALPILFCGVLSTGVAYTLQVIAQKHSPPTHAALIMQLETVFAALSGWLLLGETLSGRAMIGAGLILAGMLAAQFWNGALMESESALEVDL